MAHTEGKRVNGGECAALSTKEKKNISDQNSYGSYESCMP